MATEGNRKTKIVCTIGPASESAEKLEALIRGGMDVARLNFSHGTQEEHLRKIKNIRQIAERLEKPVAILQDLSGPKIRVGKVKEGGVELKKGEEFFLTHREMIGDERGVSVNYATLAGEVRPGDTILLSDGTIELQVLKSDGQKIQCRVMVGGVLTSQKGVNFPTRSILASAFTEKDRHDLLFGIKHGLDLIGLSYVKEAADIKGAKRFLEKESADIPVIAKIERKEALEHVDEILLASDGIMVARGDLGVETPLEKIPNVQKMLIRKANALGKPVITATQMLRSMVDHTQPTRAEVTDVVNAIYDGTDAIMLSEETASGQFPVESAQRMAVAIVTPTESGSTARWVSRLRPRQPILALSRHLSTIKRLNLCWGVHPVLVPDWKGTDDMLERSKRLPKELGMAGPGDRIVIIAGVPISIPGTTNLIKVETVE
jgi:pyruvate kinase